ncbi:MAG: hypothetical protein C5B54_02595 [Acidobacteria bacterium]|nr:MAG: hypothetical protein C5B54_02595 [Acidobacteriota bacterium]
MEVPSAFGFGWFKTCRLDRRIVIAELSRRTLLTTFPSFTLNPLPGTNGELVSRYFCGKRKAFVFIFWRLLYSLWLNNDGVHLKRRPSTYHGLQFFVNTKFAY